jgi:hypothetical protein
MTYYYYYCFVGKDKHNYIIQVKIEFELPFWNVLSRKVKSLVRKFYTFTSCAI